MLHAINFLESIISDISDISNYENRLSIMEKEDIRFIENPFKKIYNIIHPDQDKLYNILFAII